MSTEIVNLGNEHFVRMNVIPDKGDLVMYNEIHPCWSDITKYKLYPVVEKYNDHILSIYDDDDNLSSVYGNSEGYDTPDDVVVYKKIKLQDLHKYI